MKKLIVTIIGVVALLLVGVFLMKNISYIQITRVWYIAQSKYHQEKKAPSLQRLYEQGYPFAGYYYADYYKYIDIQKAIRIADKTLHDTTKRDSLLEREEFFLQRLLGSLYFYKKSYEQSSAYYWEALQKNGTNEMLRYNYELAYYFYNNDKNQNQIIEVDTYDFLPSDEIASDTMSPLPESIKNAIEKAHSFQLFIDDTANISYKPW